MPANLSKKQEIFVAEYLVDQNATRAYIAAGYSATGAAQSASALLRNPKIASHLAKVQGKRLEKLDITAERVLAELAKMGFANMLDYLEIDATGNATINLAKLTRDQGAAIQEVTIEEFMERTGPGKEDVERVKRTKFKLGDKRGSLDLLGKHLKLFTDNVNLKFGDTDGAAILEKLLS